MPFWAQAINEKITFSGHVQAEFGRLQGPRHGDQNGWVFGGRISDQAQWQQYLFQRDKLGDSSHAVLALDYTEQPVFARLSLLLQDSEQAEIRARYAYAGIRLGEGHLQLGSFGSAYAFVGGNRIDPWADTGLQAIANGGAGEGNEAGFTGLSFRQTSESLRFALDYLPPLMDGDKRLAQRFSIGMWWVAPQGSIFIAGSNNAFSSLDHSRQKADQELFFGDKSAKIGGSFLFDRSQIGWQYEEQTVFHQSHYGRQDVPLGRYWLLSFENQLDDRLSFATWVGNSRAAEMTTDISLPCPQQDFRQWCDGDRLALANGKRSGFDGVSYAVGLKTYVHKRSLFYFGYRQTTSGLLNEEDAEDDSKVWVIGLRSAW